MSNRCEICGKHRMVGNKISHSNIKTKKVYSPNIQCVKAVINGTSKKVRVCTRCLKKGKIKKS